MAQVARISEQVPLKSSAERFFESLKNNNGRLPQLFPENFKSFKFLEGDGSTNASVMHWKYHYGSPIEAEAKVKVTVDEPNKSISYECVEGDVLREFEVYRVSIQVTGGGVNGGSSVEWAVEYVPANAGAPPPRDYLQFGVKVCKGLDAYLSNN